MRKVGDERLLLYEDTVELHCEECGSTIEITANEEDRCPICEARYYTKRTVEVWRLDEDDDIEDLEEEEEGEEE